MLGQDYYYQVIQSVELTLYNLILYYAFMILLILLVTIVLCSKKINYRLFKLSKNLYFFKWASWCLEIIYFPLLLNIIEFSTCQYSS